MKRAPYLWVTIAVCAGLAVLLMPSWRLTPDRHLPMAGRLPDAARAAVKTQMHAHARGMMELVSTVTVLDYEGVQASVGRLLEEPRVARPLGTGADDLQLPERFFALQDELRRELEAVRRAAGAREPQALSDAFGAAAHTCVRCHEAYLIGR